jgi:GAF domain-containing protein
MDENDPLFGLLRRFAATMARSFDTSAVLHELSESAMTMLDAAGAGVSVVTDDGRLQFVTATDSAVVQIEEVQQAEQAGPCVEAYRTGRPSIVSDIDAVDHWPAYRETAARVGFRTVMGLPLALDGRAVGSLNVYDRRLREWSESELARAHVLVDVATAYLVRAGELAEARQLSSQLQRALDSRVVIEQAKGVLSREHEITVDEAFELLRRHSRRTQSQLRDLAHAVVHLDLQIPVD